MKISLKAGLCASWLSWLAAAPPLLADHSPLEEIVVNHSPLQSQSILPSVVAASPDSGEQLLRAPGMALNKNGPLTSLPQFRGLSGDRLAITIDGAPVTSAGPNLMDPPLSYTSPAMIESITVHRGVAPVSVSSNNMGGAAEVTRWKPAYSDAQLERGVDLGLGYASVDDSHQADLRAYLASNQQRAMVLASSIAGDDAEFPNGTITPTAYEREQYLLGYGMKAGRHALDISWRRNTTGDSGTPALPMDIQFIDGDSWQLDYGWQGDGRQLAARLYGDDNEHGMSNYHLRRAPADGANWRRNTATGEGLGAGVELTLEQAYGELLAGIELREDKHNSVIDNPNNASFFVDNYIGVKRTTRSVFVEQTLQLAKQLSTQLGVRTSRIKNSAGDVDATPAMMMPAAGTLRDEFNASDKNRSDNTVDAVLKLVYGQSPQTSYYLGLARKERAPSYQELYLWLPLESTGGLADGNLYTGDPDLKVETNHEIELGVDWSAKYLTLSPRLFYREVDNYIQGETSTVAPAIMFAAMMRPGGNPPLRFTNIDATFWGADIMLAYTLADHWQLNAVANYVRAEADDNRPLYRIAPLNGYANLQWQHQDRGAMLSIKAFAAQNRVSDTHFEQATAGGAVIGLSGYRQFNDTIRVTLGIDNAADRHYLQHLGGYNRASNADIDSMQRLPGYGRNAYLRVDASF